VLRSARIPVRRPLAPLLSVVGVVLLALAAVFALVLPAGAAAPDRRNDARLDLTIRFLQDAQNRDGGFGGRIGSASDPLFTAWVAVALAAGGVNPRDQAKPGGVDAYSYAARHARELSYTTDFERAALVAVAAGTSLRAFGKVDLMRTILSRQLPDGAFAYEQGGHTGYSNATAFAILPLSTLHERRVDTALLRGADWLLGVQEPTGAWGYAPGSEPSTDVTAAVIQALHAVGRTGTPQEAKAWDYIRSLHNPADGGFGFNAEHPESNTASTSWIVQAMWAAGVDPDRYAPGSPSPLDYLASLQRDDGSIAWKKGDDLNSVWMTAYAAPAYGGNPLPVAAVPRAETVADARRAARTPTTGALEDAPVEGQGGFAHEHGGTVIAGGGSSGAPLFSRPQPQSQGTTPGGVRNTRASARRHPGTAAHTQRTRRQHAQASTTGGAQVTGIVLGNRLAAAAPGLGGAQAGGRTPGPVLPLALVGALLLCAGLGAQLERRRPRPEPQVLA
jgi:hypothetical protein